MVASTVRDLEAIRESRWPPECIASEGIQMFYDEGYERGEQERRVVDQINGRHGEVEEAAAPGTESGTEPEPSSTALDLRVEIIAIGQRTDLDNMRKVIYDGLEGVAIENDAQVVSDRGDSLPDDGKHARVRITVVYFEEDE